MSKEILNIARLIDLQRNQSAPKIIPIGNELWELRKKNVLSKPSLDVAMESNKQEDLPKFA